LKHQEEHRGEILKMGAHEALFARLFLAADAERQGAIGGAQAVAFFSQSGLPVATLKQIWTLADARQQRVLTRSEFDTALRLVALAQQGHDVFGADVLDHAAALTLAPPRFIGESYCCGREKRWTQGS
jgi:EH domain-containing protein 1